jgi:hypothetical protein
MDEVSVGELEGGCGADDMTPQLRRAVTIIEERKTALYRLIEDEDAGSKYIDQWSSQISALNGVLPLLRAIPQSLPRAPADGCVEELRGELLVASGNLRAVSMWLATDIEARDLAEMALLTAGAAEKARLAALNSTALRKKDSG